MAKVTFEFDYHEEQTEFEMLLNMRAAYRALYDIDVALKHRAQTHELTEDEDEFFDSLRSMASDPLSYYV